MLAFLGRLAPTLVLVLGLAGGGVLTGGAGWLYTTLIHDPQLVRETKRAADDACTIRTMDAANKATAAERDRQQAAAQAAEDAYQAAIDARARLEQAVQDQHEQEIADYEKQLTAQGRSCTLDDGDLEFLRGQPGAAAAAKRGGKG